VSALVQAIAPDSSLAAASISYFALFSFFPLIVFTTVIAGTWLDNVVDKAEVVAQLEFVAPALAYLLDANLQRIVSMQQTLTGVAAISLLWSSSNIFYVLTRTLDRIHGVARRRSVWRHRGIALLSVLLISAVLLLATFLHSVVVSLVRLLAPASLLQFSGIAYQIAALAVSVALFGLLYRFLPHARQRWAQIWPGALAAGVLWEVAKRLFLFYATNYLLQPNLTQLIYGSVVTIIGFMAWAYVSSLVFLFGAYVNVGYQDRRAQGAGAGRM
jgi:membrane protein